MISSRDAYISMDKDVHKYYLNIRRFCMDKKNTYSPQMSSMTGIEADSLQELASCPSCSSVREHFEKTPFVPSVIIDNMMRSYLWKTRKHKYFGIAADLILQNIRRQPTLLQQYGSGLTIPILCFLNRETWSIDDVLQFLESITGESEDEKLDPDLKFLRNNKDCACIPVGRDSYFNWIYLSVRQLQQVQQLLAQEVGKGTPLESVVPTQQMIRAAGDGAVGDGAGGGGVEFERRKLWCEFLSWFDVEARKVIQEYWINNRDLGTLMHHYIEMYFKESKGEFPPILNTEWKQFQRLLSTEIEAKNLEFYAIEWKIYHVIDIKQGLFLPGTVDALFKNKQTGEVEMWDWKRSEKIELGNFGKFLKPPFHALADTNYYHYSIQLNLYKYILEKDYGLKISRMCLAVFHPSHEDYQIFEIYEIPSDTLEEALGIWTAHLQVAKQSTRSSS